MLGEVRQRRHSSNNSRDLPCLFCRSQSCTPRGTCPLAFCMPLSRVWIAKAQQGMSRGNARGCRVLLTGQARYGIQPPVFSAKRYLLGTVLYHVCISCQRNTRRALRRAISRQMRNKLPKPVSVPYQECLSERDQVSSPAAVRVEAKNMPKKESWSEKKKIEP